MSRYKMTISRLTVDKLGVKLYDRVSAAISEIIANSYDADAKTVTIRAPMGELLASKSKNQLLDKGFTIEIEDDGVGMTPDEINDFYLVVGAERRKDPRRGDLSPSSKRKVMGRKGVGKLAPFGICQKIEIISAGGEYGKQGHPVAHLTLDRAEILEDTDSNYYPDVGEKDGTFAAKTGTTIILRQFEHRHVPDIANLERQLSQRFGIESPDWSIQLVNTIDAGSNSRKVGLFEISLMQHTKIEFKENKVLLPDGKGGSKPANDLEAGFNHDGVFYPITGWVAYAEKPYRDELMAGIRIYCRGKIAAKTSVFNLRAGFTGEHDVRSYLVGRLDADWLDENEDLLRTDRQDILWSDELGQEFEQWGQKIVKKMGRITRLPMRVQIWDLFLEETEFIRRIEERFPGPEKSSIRSNTERIMKVIAQKLRKEEFDDKSHLESLVQIGLLLGPHITVDEELSKVADDQDSPLGVIANLMRTARIAELASFGRTADTRVRVIRKFESLISSPGADEAELQALVSESPWLINPEWHPVTSNQAFRTLRSELQKYFKKVTGEDITFDGLGGLKRPDFVLLAHEGIIQVVEIKAPGHTLQNEEMNRINTYHDVIKSFLEDPGNSAFKQIYPDFQITVVCDHVGIDGVHRTAFDGLKGQGRLLQHTWSAFLLKTRQTHEDFLKTAEQELSNETD